MDNSETRMSRTEVLRKSQEVVDVFGAELARNGRVAIYFVTDCVKCGVELIFGEPNILYENTRCEQCGTHQAVERVGFKLAFALCDEDIRPRIKEKLDAVDEKQKELHQRN